MKTGVILGVLFVVCVQSFGQVTGTGTAVILDARYSSNDMVYCDSLYLSMTNVSSPAPGMRYYAWLLADNDATYLLLGPLTVSSGNIVFGYNSTTNLVALYKKFIITEEIDPFGGSTPTLENTRFVAALYAGVGSPGPSNALTYIRNAIGSFSTPSNLGLMTWLVRQLIKPDNFVQHAGFAVGASTINDVKVHSDHVYDFVQGVLFNPGHGSVANNNDPLGYSFYRYGDLDTLYSPLGGAGYHIGRAIQQSDATANMVTEGTNSLVSLRNVFGANNVSGWAKEVSDTCLWILTTTFPNLAAAQAAATIMRNLALKVQDGLAGSGNINPDSGGIFTAYRRAQMMATYLVEPVANAIDDGDPHPRGFRLYQNYPNPFNASTTVAYRVASRELVSLKIFDLLGQEVTTLVREIQSPGTYAVTFDATDMPSGVYVYRLSAGTSTDSKKLILLK